MDFSPLKCSKFFQFLYICLFFNSEFFSYISTYNLYARSSGLCLPYLSYSFSSLSYLWPYTLSFEREIGLTSIPITSLISSCQENSWMPENLVGAHQGIWVRECGEGTFHVSGVQARRGCSLSICLRLFFAWLVLGFFGCFVFVVFF